MVLHDAKRKVYIYKKHPEIMTLAHALEYPTLREYLTAAFEGETGPSLRKMNLAGVAKKLEYQIDHGFAEEEIQDTAHDLENLATIFSKTSRSRIEDFTLQVRKANDHGYSDIRSVILDYYQTLGFKYIGRGEMIGEFFKKDEQILMVIATLNTSRDNIAVTVQDVTNNNFQRPASYYKS